MAKRVTKKRRPTLSDQLRQAVLDSGLTRYRIARQTGIDAGQLHRFVHGEAWLGRAAIDALGELLNLRIVER